MVQAAKDNAVDETKLLVSQKVIGRPNVKVIPPEDTQKVVENICSDRGYIDSQLNYVARGFATLKRLAESYGFSSEQEELLGDIAFMGRGDLLEGKFMEMLQPIANSLISGDWEEAYRERDFLMTYFPHMFPEWKRKNIETEGTTFKSIEQFVIEIHPSLETIPSSYRAVILAKMAENEERLRRLEEPKERRRFGEQLLIEAIKVISQQYGQEFDPSKPVYEENTMPLKIRGYVTRGGPKTVHVTEIKENEDGSKLFVFSADYASRRGSGSYTYIGKLELLTLISQLIETKALNENVLAEVYGRLKGNAPKSMQDMSLKEVLTATFNLYTRGRRDIEDHRIVEINRFIQTMTE